MIMQLRFDVYGFKVLLGASRRKKLTFMQSRKIENYLGTLRDSILSLDES